MAQKTITVNATASLSANGKSTATGSITWTAPSLPSDALGGWNSIRISGTWSWGGKGNITRVTINGTNTSADSAFDIALSTSQSSPLSITCVGGNKNATGANFRWSGLIVTYTYTTAASSMTVSYNGNTILTAEVETPVSVLYNGSSIASLTTGIKTLYCNGMVMASDISIADKTLYCSGKIMASNITITIS